MSTILQDLRFAIRQLRRTPGFAFIAVLTLALGIGVNTAIFSVMNAVLLRGLPGANPDRLVFLHYQDQPDHSSQTGYDDASLSQPVFEQFRQDHRVFSDLMGFVPISAFRIGLRYGNDLEQGYADMVSGNFFSGLGVRPVLGRTFSMEDEKNHTPVAVLSYSYWTARFNRDPSILGQTIFVRAVPFTIVGVAAPGFLGLERRNSVDVWVPFQNRLDLKPWGVSVQDRQGLYSAPDWFFLMMIGRLKPGITEQQALAQLNPEYKTVVEQTVGKQSQSAKISLYFTPGKGIEGLNQDYKEPLRRLMGMVLLILVIACTNIAMLLIARNTARNREFSVRLALGGSRARIFGQLFTESLLLVTVGGVLGWLFAGWATTALAKWSELQASLAPDRYVLWFTIGISALAALVFGLAPLRSATHAPIALSIKSSALSAQHDRSKSRFGKAVLAVQISLCLVLLVGAGLLLRTLWNLGNVNVGFRPTGLVVFGVNPPANITSDEQIAQFYASLLGRVRALPEVESATVMENRIGAGWSDNTAIRVDGAEPNPGKFSPIRTNPVGPNYFHLLDTHLMMGRDISESDTAASQKVMIVNQTFVDRYLKGKDPLGHTVSLASSQDKFLGPYSIIGVVPDLKYTAVAEKPRPMGWFPFVQISGESNMQVEVRTEGNAAALLEDVRGIMRDFGPDIPLLEPMTQSAQLEQSYSDQKLFSRLATFFGLLAALLVATGLYGTLAYRVSRRTSEIGVRMALGAQRQQVLWMVLKESFTVAVMGVAFGLPLAFVGARLLKSMLYGCGPADPLTFLLALAAVALVAVIAAFMPARHASSVDPMVALRYE